MTTTFDTLHINQDGAIAKATREAQMRLTHYPDLMRAAEISRNKLTGVLQDSQAQ